MSVNLLILFIFFVLINKHYSYIVISIKGNNPIELYNNSKTENTEDYIFSSINNNLYTLMGIGKPDQNVVIKINPNQKDFLFNENNCKIFYNDKYINKNELSPNNITITINKSKIGYLKNESKSFEKNNEIKLDSNYNTNFFCAKERLKLDDYRNILIKDEFNNTEIIYPYSQNNLINFNFVYEENDSKEEICGSIGLASYNDKNNNKFIEQLKTSNITENYYWHIKYISLDKGFIIFGILPHQYLNNKNNETFNSENFLEIYNNFAIESNHWDIEFDELFFYLNKKDKKEKILINNNVNADFTFTKQLIVGSLNYRSIIIEHFFKEYFNANICLEETFFKNISYSIIKCYKNKFDKEKKKFPEIYFYNKGLQTNFILSHEDLFITLGNFIYFMIIFRTSLTQQKNEIWELGIPFLKKHQLIFNSDTKKIGYYSNLNKNKNKNSKVKITKKNLNLNISIRTLLEIFIGLIMIIFIIYLIKKIYNNKIRQKRPYELQDEDYDYFDYKRKIKKDNIDINNSYENKLINGQIIEMKSNK